MESVTTATAVVYNASQQCIYITTGGNLPSSQQQYNESCLKDRTVVSFALLVCCRSDLQGGSGQGGWQCSSTAVAAAQLCRAKQQQQWWWCTLSSQLATTV